MKETPSSLLQKYFHSMDGKSGKTIPRLSKNEEIRLFRAWKNKGDKKALDKLILSNLRFVVRQANKHRGFCDGKAITIMDLIQAGNEGMLRAVERFKTSKKVRFITCANYWIDAYIKHFIYDNVSTVRIPETQYTRNFILQKKTINHVFSSRNPEDVEQWEKQQKKRYGMSIETLEKEKAKLFLINSQTSMDKNYSNEQQTNLHDVFYSNQFNTGHLVENKEQQDLLKQKITEALKTLPPRYCDVLEMRYMKDENYTLEDLGEKYQVSRQSVYATEQSAFQKMRELLKDDPLVKEILAC